MNQYSKQSEERLSQCDRLLQEVFREVLKTFNHTILEGHREKEAQDKAFMLGRSKLKWPNGKHNQRPSRAVDAIPYPVDFKDITRVCYFAGFVMATAKMMGIKIRWGGDWNSNTKISDETFKDLLHFEIVEKPPEPIV